MGLFLAILALFQIVSVARPLNEITYEDDEWNYSEAAGKKHARVY